MLSFEYAFLIRKYELSEHIFGYVKRIRKFRVINIGLYLQVWRRQSV